MNLKQEITRTENLETKLAKGITNINNVIVRGGGCTIYKCRTDT